MYRPFIKGRKITYIRPSLVSHIDIAGISLVPRRKIKATAPNPPRIMNASHTSGVTGSNCVAICSRFCLKLGDRMELEIFVSDLKSGYVEPDHHEEGPNYHRRAGDGRADDTFPHPIPQEQGNKGMRKLKKKFNRNAVR